MTPTYKLDPMNPARDSMGENRQLKAARLASHGPDPNAPRMTPPVAIALLGHFIGGTIQSITSAPEQPNQLSDQALGHGVRNTQRFRVRVPCKACILAYHLDDPIILKHGEKWTGFAF